jgi:K+-transporting ATPase ATPase A chain
VIQNLKPYTSVATLEGGKQTIAQGPVASQEAIKELGTNGGGFFNANSAHPFENPTPVTNLFEMFLLLVIPSALTYTFGRMVGDTRQGWAILAAFLIMALVLLCYKRLTFSAARVLLKVRWRWSRPRSRPWKKSIGWCGRLLPINNA